MTIIKELKSRLTVQVGNSTYPLIDEYVSKDIHVTINDRELVIHRHSSSDVLKINVKRDVVMFNKNDVMNFTNLRIVAKNIFVKSDINVVSCYITCSAFENNAHIQYVYHPTYPTCPTFSTHSTFLINAMRIRNNATITSYTTKMRLKSYSFTSSASSKLISGGSLVHSHPTSIEIDSRSISLHGKLTGNKMVISYRSMTQFAKINVDDLTFILQEKKSDKDNAHHAGYGYINSKKLTITSTDHDFVNLGITTTYFINVTGRMINKGSLKISEGCIDSLVNEGVVSHQKGYLTMKSYINTGKNVELGDVIFNLDPQSICDFTRTKFFGQIVVKFTDPSVETSHLKQFIENVGRCKLSNKVQLRLYLSKNQFLTRNDDGTFSGEGDCDINDKDVKYIMKHLYGKHYKRKSQEQ